MSATTAFLSTLSIGIGATLVMDLWTLMLKRIGVATLNYAMVGRWVGHMGHGHLRHEAIAKAAPIGTNAHWAGSCTTPPASPLQHCW